MYRMFSLIASLCDHFDIMVRESGSSLHSRSEPSSTPASARHERPALGVDSADVLAEEPRPAPLPSPVPRHRFAAEPRVGAGRQAMARKEWEREIRDFAPATAATLLSSTQAGRGAMRSTAAQPPPPSPVARSGGGGRGGRSMRRHSSIQVVEFANKSRSCWLTSAFQVLWHSRTFRRCYQLRFETLPGGEDRCVTFD